MDLQMLFDQAFKAAEEGDYVESAKAYRSFLDSVQGAFLAVAPSEQFSAIRAAALNLAQVLNKLCKYEDALRYVELGLRQAGSPTAYGRAIGFSAKGEALCGLGRQAQG